MQAGNFNRYTTIEQRQESGDGFAWITFKRWWCKRLSGPGRETFANAQTLSKTDARYIGPWTSGVDPTMRLVDGDDIWNIEDAEADDETGRDYLTLRVSKGTNAG
jgi:head-tail adaptor